MRFLIFVFAASIALVGVDIQSSGAQKLLTSDEAAKVLRFDNLNVSTNSISGMLVNTSPHRVKDIELLIQYHWLWDNERHPGQDSPGRTFTLKLDKELSPGGTLPFSYRPPQLTQRSDGRFMPEVDIGGFAVVIPQQRSAQR
jgi:hypothetical protein